MDGYMEDASGDTLQDLVSLYSSGFGKGTESEEEYPVNENLEEEFTEG
jgi:hypothetical protein